MPDGIGERFRQVFARELRHHAEPRQSYVFVFIGVFCEPAFVRSGPAIPKRLGELRVAAQL